MNRAEILIVSNEPQSRSALRAAFRREDFAIHEARTPEHARMHLTSSCMHATLVDLDMPMTALIQVCGELRRLSEAALFVLRAGTTSAETVAILEAGADEFLRKPLSHAELVVRVRVLLRRLRPQAEWEQKIVHLDHLEINLTMRRVLNHGKATHLTPKEFELLKYLVANPNATIPHARLLHRIWGREYTEQTAALRVVINQLRRKIEPDPANPRYLVTEPWVGYRFEIPVQA